MFKVKNKKFDEFLDDIGLKVSDAKKYFVPENIFQLSIIPLALSSFLSILNDKVDITKPCEILMRDKECDALWNIMLKKNKRNAVIVGAAGVGKSALIEKITYDVEKGSAPSQFKDFKVISLDVNSLIAGTRFRGDSEERISELIKFLEKNSNVILFIDEVHTILGAGSCFEGEMDLANALKPILARGDTIVIGATTIDEYEKYFKSDAALSRRFEKVEVEEPMSCEVYPMIKNKLDVLSDFHGVTISEELVEYAILIANCFAFDKQNPDKTLDLIDRAMVTAKRSRKKYVDKKSILHNFDIFFDDWDNMSNKAKRITAYHEVGHYIVGKTSTRLSNRKYLAISIMPAEDYLGVTVHEYDNHVVPFKDLDYYIDEIATCLAGRVAEKLFTKTYSSGASADLKEATKIAYSVVAKLGLVEDEKSLRNRVFVELDEGTMISEKATNLINDEITSLIDRAYKRAEELITQNQDILRAIVNALLKKHIMSEVELDTIWQDIVNSRESSESLKKAKS